MIPSSLLFVTKNRLLIPLWGFLLFSAATTLSAQTVTALRIDTCYARAARNYPLIKQYDLIEKTKEYTISNANKAYIPQLSITGIGAYIISGIPSITMPNAPAPEKKDIQFIGIAQLNQTIWDGGATHAQKKIAKADAAIDKATIDVSIFQLHERINQLYFGILVIDEQLKQLEILMENLNRSLKKIKLTMDNGIAYQSDVDEVKAEILVATQRKSEFLFTRKGFVEMLSFMTGTPFEGDVQLEKPLILESYQTLTGNRPELKLYAEQTNLIDASASFDKVKLMPKVGVLAAGILIESGISFGTETINSLALAGLSLSWSTAGLNTFWLNKKVQKVNIEKISTQKETFLFNNALQLKQNASDVEKQKAIVQTDGEIVSLKNKIRASYQLKYDNGLCSMNDLINAINKESEALRNQALHQVQLLLSVYTYKTNTGN